MVNAALRRLYAIFTRSVHHAGVSPEASTYSPPPTPLTGRRAVIVEDDATLAAELESLLAGEGIATLRVAARQDVDDVLRRFDPHACLIDIDLAGDRAAELVELFALLFPDARPIALASDPADPRLGALLQRHGAEAVAKPVRPALLMGAVARCGRAHDEARERRTLRAELARAKQTASTLLAVASHELRTPLNAIIGFSELLERPETADPETVREYARTIHRSGVDLLGVIEDMLCFAALDAGVREAALAPFDLDEEIDAALAHAAIKAQAAGVTLTRRIAQGLPALHADRQLVGKALAALLDNAVRFAAERGRRASVVVRPADTGGLLLQVADNGPGIDETRLAGLARPFALGGDVYTRTQGGMGLGLALARKAMELHGGRLELRSRVNVGTVAALVFPEERLRRR